MGGVLKMRGKIRFPERKQQINDFSNIIYGKITPTDIDGLIEYKNKAYIFFEIKYNNTPICFGQKLALERLVKDLSIKKDTIAIIADHYVSDTNSSVKVEECIVREIFGKKGIWECPKYKTVKETIDNFIKYIDSEVIV